MDISKVNPDQLGVSKSYKPKSEDRQPQEKKEIDNDDSRFVRSSSLPIEGYNQNGESVTKVQSSNQNLSLAELKESIKKEIWDQTFQLLKDIISQTVDTSLFDQGIQEMVEFSGDENDPLGLIEYFAVNPNDWEEVMHGQVPEYFNIENTGQRILDIWLPSYNDSMDIETWLAETKDELSSIYDEVADMVGGLPQLVQDTRDFVIAGLEDFADGIMNQGGQ